MSIDEKRKERIIGKVFVPSSILLLLTIFSLVIFSTGCTSTTTIKNFRTGTEGLVIEFSKDNPSSVYEREEFGMAMIVKNAGSTDVLSSNPAVLKVNYDNYRMYGVGGYYDQTDLGINKYSSISIPDIKIFGKSIEYPVGDEQAAAFYFVTNSLTHLRESATTKISYNLCYPYTTLLTIMTCIDTKGQSNDFAPVACKSETYNGGSGQGGPIAITRIEPEILLQSGYVRPQFKIYIENRGKGFVTSNHRCGEVDLNNHDYAGRVNIDAWLSEQKLDCGPDNNGSLRLVDSESFIRCSLSPDNDLYPTSQKNYITPLTISINYTYTTIDEKEIEIKRNDLLDEKAIQGLCGVYEKYYQNKCVSKCEYCAQYPGDDACKDNVVGYFVFNANFTCSCDLSTCNAKQDRYNCIKGYCPGSSYCCTDNKCNQYQIEYAGECINRCLYCSSKNTTDTSICKVQNFTNFECKSMTKDQCVAAKSSCRQGYCSGDNSYCSNSSNYSMTV